MKKILLLIVLGLTTIISTFGQDLSNLKDAKPFQVSGSIDARTIVYSSTGIAGRRSPFTYILSGAPVFSVYGFTIPVSFTISEQDRSFSQPFNQVGLSPQYKWIKLHAGYRNISFSPYTLAGHTVLGAGVELTPGKFQFGFMTGRLNRATTIDTLSGYVRPESFSRYGTAIKVGYGTAKKGISLSFLSAKDSNKGFKGNLDSTLVKKEANTVLGGEFNYLLLKKLAVFGDGAVSIYTKDLHSDLEIDLDTARKGLNTLKNLFKLNATSEYALAYSAGLAYTDKLFSLKAAYKIVEPNFRSMGAYFFQNDLKNITLSPSVVLNNGKLRFTGSLGIQQDNQKKKKMTSTKRVITMANLGWDITDKFGFDANYTNFSASSEPTVALVDQKYLLAQTNENFSATPRLVLVSQQTTQVILLSLSGSRLKDLNESVGNENDIFSKVAFLNYNLTLNQNAMNINAGLNYVDNKLSMGYIKNQGFNLGATKGLLKNKVSLSTQNSYTLTELIDGKGSILNLGIHASYLAAKSHRFNLRCNYMTNRSEREALALTKFSELTGEVGYTFSF